MRAVCVLAICFVSYLHTTYGLTDQEQSQFDAEVQLVKAGEVYRFFSSGFPEHEIDNDVNPNEASVQNFTYNITITPNNDVDTVWCTNLGPVGFAKNGVAIYNALTGQGTDAVLYEEFDDCKGHSSPSGSYHYHQFSSCVGDIANQDEFIGIAIDGNPIYGPNASDVTALLTSADLDACHGRFVDGIYRYHFTADFPYVIGCFKAEPAESAAGMMRPGGPGGEEGQGGPGGRPPGGMMDRKRRQTQEATCTNTDSGAQLCDCTAGTLTQCDTLADADQGDCDDNNGEDETDDGKNGASYLQLSTFILAAQAFFILYI